MLSDFPFYSCFIKTLVFLHGLIEKPTSIPIERYISNLFESKILSFVRFHFFFSFIFFSFLLSTKILSLVLTERRIILHYSNECKLTPNQKNQNQKTKIKKPKSKNQNQKTKIKKPKSKNQNQKTKIKKPKK